MNFQQLEYVVAVDAHRHFGKAAAACFVTQPTLSMMIQKLEEELDVKVFDRTKKPVTPTDIGVLIIAQAKKILWEAEELKEIIREQSTTLEGELKVGIIPTLAPYLVPLFIQKMLKKYANLHLKISEMRTEDIIVQLKNGSLDAGILATPLHETTLIERPLFYEPFWVYSTADYGKEYLLPDDIDPNDLWLLEEGHCLRTQIGNLCELQKASNFRLQYESGSIETLKSLVEKNTGTTILPELATLSMSAKKKKWLKPFQQPVPVREVSLVTYRHFFKRRLMDVLEKEIVATIPERMKRNDNTMRVELV